MRNSTLNAPSAALPPICAMPKAMALAECLDVRAARLAAIKADIAQHLASPELTVAAVAARQGVTSRYVQQLFQREGTTYSEFVLCQRLLSAHRMLGDALFARWSITAIAFEAGFGDLSYFNRSFRRRYVASPFEVREAARARLCFGEPTVRSATNPSSLQSKTGACDGGGNGQRGVPMTARRLERPTP